MNVKNKTPRFDYGEVAEFWNDRLVAAIKGLGITKGFLGQMMGVSGATMTGMRIRFPRELKPFVWLFENQINKNVLETTVIKNLEGELRYTKQVNGRIRSLQRRSEAYPFAGRTIKFLVAVGSGEKDLKEDALIELRRRGYTEDGEYDREEYSLDQIPPSLRVKLVRTIGGKRKGPKKKRKSYYVPVEPGTLTETGRVRKRPAKRRSVGKHTKKK